MDAITPGAEGEEKPSELLTDMVSDRCANCETSLAPDQRYCLNCGQRRGKPRFPISALTAKPAPEPPKRERKPRVTPATTLVAGVATLLLALGVGVLIGKGSGNSKNASAPVQVITAGGTGAGVASGGAGAQNATALAKHHKGKFVKPTVVHLTPQVKAAANAAAAKVLGNTNNLVKDPTVQVGDSCSGGAGCQNGKFTGNFFGGGQ